MQGVPGQLIVDKSTKAATTVGIVATILNLIGLGLAIYLTIEHYSTTPTFACPVTKHVNCLAVTTSTYSKFAGVPVALAGLIYFIVSLGLHLPPMWKSANKVFSYLRWAWVLVGMISVFWLLHAEIQLDAICLYCTGVHVVTFLLLIVTAVGNIVTAPVDSFEE